MGLDEEAVENISSLLEETHWDKPTKEIRPLVSAPLAPICAAYMLSLVYVQRDQIVQQLGLPALQTAKAKTDATTTVTPLAAAPAPAINSRA